MAWLVCATGCNGVVSVFDSGAVRCLAGDAGAGRGAARHGCGLRIAGCATHGWLHLIPLIGLIGKLKCTEYLVLKLCGESLSALFC